MDENRDLFEECPEAGSVCRCRKRIDISDLMDRLKVVLREKECPFFTDEELAFYLKEERFNFNATAYRLLIMKSEPTALTLSGLEVADMSKYFRRLAQRYRKCNSGVLGAANEWGR